MFVHHQKPLMYCRTFGAMPGLMPVKPWMTFQQIPRLTLATSWKTFSSLPCLKLKLFTHQMIFRDLSFRSLTPVMHRVLWRTKGASDELQNSGISAAIHQGSITEENDALDDSSSKELNTFVWEETSDEPLLSGDVMFSIGMTCMYMATQWGGGGGDKCKYKKFWHWQVSRFVTRNNGSMGSYTMHPFDGTLELITKSPLGEKLEIIN